MVDEGRGVECACIGGGGREGVDVDDEADDDGPALDEEEDEAAIVVKLGIAAVFIDGLVGVERLFPFLSLSAEGVAGSATTPPSFVCGFSGEGGVIGIGGNVG